MEPHKVEAKTATTNNPMASTSYAYVVNATTTPVPSLEFDVPVNTSIACLWGVPSPSFAPNQVSVSPRPYDDVDIHLYVPISLVKQLGSRAKSVYSSVAQQVTNRRQGMP